MKKRKGSKQSGSEKAAQFLMVMGEESAADILRQLSSDEVQKIGFEMNGMGEMGVDDVNKVLISFLDQSQQDTSISMESEKFTRSVLVQALGDENADRILAKITLGGSTRGLDSLKWMEPQLIAGIIETEHPQIQAIVVSHLGEELAGEVLANLPEDAAVELVIRMAEMESVDPAALQELNETLEKQVEGVVSKKSPELGGVKSVAGIFNALDKAFEERLMKKIAEQTEDTAERIQEEMFVFDDLKKIPDRDFQKLLRELATDQLVLALKGADKTIEEKVLKNMSSRAAEIFVEDMESLGPVRVSDVEEAQKEILSATKELADAGEISLGQDASGMIG